MVRGIVAPYQAWFCQNCHDTSDILYIDEEDKRYCHRCVPTDVKEKAEYMNQIRKPVEYKK
jgi:hypothetical protein